MSMTGEGEPLREEVEDLLGEKLVSLRYLKIPLLSYWLKFSTGSPQPTKYTRINSRVRGLIWYHLTELIYGPGAATLQNTRLDYACNACDTQISGQTKFVFMSRMSVQECRRFSSLC